MKRQQPFKLDEADCWRAVQVRDFRCGFVYAVRSSQLFLQGFSQLPLLQWPRSFLGLERMRSAFFHKRILCDPIARFAAHFDG
jgi:hypothetical protein